MPLPDPVDGGLEGAALGGEDDYTFRRGAAARRQRAASAGTDDIETERCVRCRRA